MVALFPPALVLRQIRVSSLSSNHSANLAKETIRLTNTQILFPSGAYISYGRVTPQEIPRVVEETILKGRVVPGLLRNAVGVVREGGAKGVGCASGNGILGW